MLLFYRFLFGLVLPFLVLVEIKRGARRVQLAMRFGFYDASYSAKPKSYDLWFHAASVGEINAALNLVTHLRKRTTRPMLVTCATASAFLLARRAFPPDCCVVLLPYDLLGPIQHFLARFNPRRLIIVENDFWPLLLYVARKRKIGITAVSSSLSPAARRKRRWLALLAYPFWRDLDAVAAQTPQDARQFIKLGLEPARATVCGNLKFDMRPPPFCFSQGRALRQRLGGKHRPTWIAASVHPAESARILDAHAALLRARPRSVLILVPRHLHRGPRFEKILMRRQFSYCALSVLQTSRSSLRLTSIQVILGDTTGDLLKLYAASDLAFVGGSLINKGGHNPIEPALLACPIVMGPYIHKAGVAAALLRRCGALQIVDESKALTQLLPDLMTRSPRALSRMGEAARKAIQQKSQVAVHLSDVLRRAA